MKYIFFLIAAVFATITISAQNISVRSFKTLSNDLEARINFPKKDQNGDVCAIIKIVTTETGFVWDSDASGIVEVVNKTGEYWIYVPYGAKRLTIKHDKLGILRDYIYPEPILKATVYEMVLSTGKVVTTVVDDEIKTTWLTLKSTPEGADIYINDVLQNGVTPLSIKLKSGKYTYRLEKIMCHNEAGVVEITGDESEGKKEINFTMRPAFGYVEINTTPESRATVLIDDNEVNGKTPFTSDKLKSGKHKVTVKKEMFAPVSQEFEIIDEKTTELNIKMSASAVNMTISSNPDGADVYFDDALVGTTPLQKNINIGKYNYQIEKKLYHKKEGVLEITGEVTKKDLNVTLDPAFGYLKIVTTPENGAIILIDDNEVNGKTPYTSDKLKSGKHKITVKKEMYQPKSIELLVKDGQTTVDTVMLTPNFANITISTQPEADIYIDGNKTGVGSYKGRIQAGVHTFEAKKEKYSSDKKDKEIQVGEDVLINLILQPKQGIIDIVSIPTEADVYLNGEKKGTTPLTLKKVNIGDYVLKFEKQGFGDVIKTITVTEAKTTDVKETLPAGKDVKIICSDEGALLVVDGNPCGILPQIVTLSFGEHTLSAKKSGCTENQQKFTVSQNDLGDKGVKVINLNAGCVIFCNDSRDEKKYKTVKIGNKIWMTENLNYITSNGSWCYNNETSNCDKYGRLYNWETAKNVCPSDWHLPSDVEWSQLADNLGGKSIAGGKLKSTNDWKSPNTGADNSSGFSAIPCGDRNSNGVFSSIGYLSSWWSSTEYGKYNAWRRGLSYSNSNIERYDNDKAYGFSVRCVRDF